MHELKVPLILAEHTPVFYLLHVVSLIALGAGLLIAVETLHKLILGIAAH
jgi:hypothetical protein